MEELFRVSRLELRTDDTLYADAGHAKSLIPWLVETIGATRVAHAPQEVAWVVTVDSHARVYTLVEVGRGTPRSIHLHIPTMLQAVLTAGTERFIYVHSHPSGSPIPTPVDIDTTEAIAEAAALCGIQLADALVITRDPKQYTSLVKAGLFVPSELG